MANLEKLGVSEDRLRRVRPAVEKHIRDDAIAGAVTLLARRGEIFHLKSYGQSSREFGTPMTEDAIFRIYSMTKPITCVALLSLFEQGLFQLTDPVSRFIPGMAEIMVQDGENLVEQNPQMQIWHLFTHTSGFSYPHDAPPQVEELYRENVKITYSTLEDLVNGLLQTRLLFQPGARFRYGFSQDVAARLVEIISGKSFDAYLKEEIFDPLGMADTGFYLSPDKADRLTSMYGVFNLDDQAPLDERMRAVEEGRNDLLEDKNSDYHAKPHTFFRGGHGLVSTAQDYYRFCAMLLARGEYRGGRILGPKTVELMCMNHLPLEILPHDIGGIKIPGEGYGLGVRVMMDPGQAHAMGSVGEFGWGGAASTYFWIDPVEEFIGIQMAQYQPSGAFSIGSDLRVAAYQALID